MKLQIIKNHGFIIPFKFYQLKKLVFIPTWLLFTIAATCTIVSFAAIRIEKDEPVKVTTIQVQPEAEAVAPIEYKSYEYVIGNDTFLMNEDPTELFKRKIKKQLDKEAAAVERVEQDLKVKFSIVKDQNLILSEIRKHTREILFKEVPAVMVEQYAPTITVTTEKVKITKPHPIVTEQTKPKPKAEKLTFGAYTPAEAKAYIKRWADVAKEQEKKYGIPAAVTLSQALHESNAGKSRLARQNNNHFGIKCFSRKCTKGHCTNYTDDTHKDFFRTFLSDWQSFEEHSKFLLKDRYKHLLKLDKSDYKSWCKGLKNAGYATDKGYHLKLIKTIEKYKLNEI